jgi:hypothetical protein
MIRLAPLGLLALALLLLAPAASRAALRDSRDPVEPAPQIHLGPPRTIGAGNGVTVAPAGVEIHVAPSRRSARVTAAWEITAPPGPLLLDLPSTLFQVSFPGPGPDPGAPAPPEVEITREDGAALPRLDEVRIDPGSGKVYAVEPTAPSAQTAGVPLFHHRLRLHVPSSGRLLLRAEAVVPSGSDRVRRRVRPPERTHALHGRQDPLVYHFAVAGPAGPAALHLPARTVGRTAYERGALRVAVALMRPFPLGLTVGVGGALAGGPEGGRELAGLLRLGLDGLLPWGDVVSLTADGTTRFTSTGGHGLSAALVYQLHTPAYRAFPLLYLSGHVDLGPVLSIFEDGVAGLRPGLRLGLGANLSALGLLAGADLYPMRADPPPGEAGPGRHVLRYRLSLLLSVGL